MVIVDETKEAVEDREGYVRVALDRHTFELIYVEVTLDRSDLDAQLFLCTVLKRCRYTRVVIVDRSLWYNSSLDESTTIVNSVGKPWQPLCRRILVHPPNSALTVFRPLSQLQLLALR